MYAQPFSFYNLTSKGGYKFDILCSALQKGVRRGEVYLVEWALAEFLASGKAGAAFTRLEVLLESDVGPAEPDLLAEWSYIRTHWKQLLKKNGPAIGKASETILVRQYLLGIGALMCGARKTRIVADAAAWALYQLYQGHLIELPDPEMFVATDMDKNAPTAALLKAHALVESGHDDLRKRRLRLLTRLEKEVGMGSMRNAVLLGVCCWFVDRITELMPNLTLQLFVLLREMCAESSVARRAVHAIYQLYQEDISKKPDARKHNNPLYVVCAILLCMQQHGTFPSPFGDAIDSVDVKKPTEERVNQMISFTDPAQSRPPCGKMPSWIYDKTTEIGRSQYHRNMDHYLSEGLLLNTVQFQQETLNNFKEDAEEYYRNHDHSCFTETAEYTGVRLDKLYSLLGPIGCDRKGAQLDDPLEEKNEDLCNKKKRRNVTELFTSAQKPKKSKVTVIDDDDDDDDDDLIESTFPLNELVSSGNDINDSCYVIDDVDLSPNPSHELQSLNCEGGREFKPVSGESRRSIRKNVQLRFLKKLYRAKQPLDTYIKQRAWLTADGPLEAEAGRCTVTYCQLQLPGWKDALSYVVKGPISSKQYNSAMYCDVMKVMMGLNFLDCFGLLEAQPSNQIFLVMSDVTRQTQIPIEFVGVPGRSERVLVVGHNAMKECLRNLGDLMCQDYESIDWDEVVRILLFRFVMGIPNTTMQHVVCSHQYDHMNNRHDEYHSISEMEHVQPTNRLMVGRILPQLRDMIQEWLSDESNDDKWRKCVENWHSFFHAVDPFIQKHCEKLLNYDFVIN